MSRFSDFVDEVLEGVAALAIGSLGGLAAQIREDAQAFIDSTRVKLKKWTKMLADGQLDEDEFAFLVLSQKDLAEMTAIAAAGITAARIRRLRDDVISLIINVAIGRFLP